MITLEKLEEVVWGPVMIVLLGKNEKKAWQSFLEVPQEYKTYEVTNIGTYGEEVVIDIKLPK